jgi:hypothetical protein
MTAGGGAGAVVGPDGTGIVFGGGTGTVFGGGTGIVFGGGTGIVFGGGTGIVFGGGTGAPGAATKGVALCESWLASIDIVRRAARLAR